MDGETLAPAVSTPSWCGSDGKKHFTLLKRFRTEPEKKNLSVQKEKESMKDTWLVGGVDLAR